MAPKHRDGNGKCQSSFKEKKNPLFVYQEPSLLPPFEIKTALILTDPKTFNLFDIIQNIHTHTQ